MLQCKIVIKSFILGNGPVYHSTDYCEYREIKLLEHAMKVAAD